MLLWFVCALRFRATQSTHILFVVVHQLNLGQVQELVAGLWLITKPVPLDWTSFDWPQFNVHYINSWG